MNNPLDLINDTLITTTYRSLQQNNIHLSNKKIKSALIDFITQAFDHFNKNPPFPSIQEIERRAITHVITIAKRIQEQQQLQPQQQLQQPQQQQQQQQPQQQLQQPQQQFQQQPQHQFQQQPQQQNDDTIISKTINSYIKIDLDTSEPLPLPQIEVKENDESSFLRKLEDLEITRRIRPDINQLQNPPIDYIPLQQPIPQIPQVIAAPTVIYIPTKTKISDLKQMIINSIDRNWEYNPKRSIFIWSGNIPNDENIKLAFAGIFLPKIVATISPVIIIEIEGAGGKKQSILCSLNSEGPIWDKWYVIRTADSKDTTIRPIACPWTIKLFDIYQNLLELGEDCHIIKSVDVLLNGNAKMILENDTDDFDNNNLFIIKKNDNIIGKYKIINKLNNMYQINCVESTNNSEKYNHLEGAIICNISHQVTMIIEIQKNQMQNNDKK